MRSFTRISLTPSITLIFILFIFILLQYEIIEGFKTSIETLDHCKSLFGVIWKLTSRGRSYFAHTLRRYVDAHTHTHAHTLQPTNSLTSFNPSTQLPPIHQPTHSLQLTHQTTPTYPHHPTPTTPLPSLFQPQLLHSNVNANPKIPRHSNNHNILFPYLLILFLLPLLLIFIPTIIQTIPNLTKRTSTTTRLRYRRFEEW